MSQPYLRAADSDRAAVAAGLGEHMAAGRLTLDEYDERLTRAYAARTFGELEELTADLPALDTLRVPEPADQQAPAPTPEPGCGPSSQDAVASAWRSWLTTALIVLGVWLTISLAAGVHYFWPVWVIGPWGAVLLAQTLVSGGRGNHRNEGEERPRLGS